MNTGAVIGAGAWGTALARHLAAAGATVRLWAHEPEVVESIREKRENIRFLPGIPLPPSLTPSSSLHDALQDADWLIFAVPSHVARAVLAQIGPVLAGRSDPMPVVSATKGIEEDSLLLMTQVMQETLPASLHGSLTVLSGPSFAAEVSRDLPAAVTLAGTDDALVRRLQARLMTPRFRVYRGADPIGVQLGGALKNVVALAAGIVDGLGLGHSARAALLTRGLAEMIRLGRAMGADPRTFEGLSGLGDLVLTCTGSLSRNHIVGVQLGQGKPLASVLASLAGVAEGVRTSRAAQGLAARHGVDMPIVREVCAVLFEGKPCPQAAADLMERTAKEETDVTRHLTSG
jgi:glycerol-3-phosphate dehydrogenase (NAD(P)+)